MTNDDLCTTKDDLDSTLQSAESQLCLARFALYQVIQSATLAEGEDSDSPIATYNVEREYMDVLVGASEMIWSLCDRLHEVLKAY